jgi:hypothetical protein
MKEKIKIKLLQEVGLDGTRENPVYKAYGEIINAKDLGLTMADADLDGNYPVHVWWEISDMGLHLEGDGDCCDWDNPISVKSAEDKVQSMLDAGEIEIIS